MKKLVLLIIVASFASTAAFAELGIGGAALYKSPVLLGQPVDLGNHNIDQFSIGADLRYKLGWFQAEGLLVYSAGAFNSLALFLDGGVGLDLAIFRLSIGAGPNFNANFGAPRPAQAGLNAKIGADARFGALSVGLTYIMVLNLANGIDVNTQSGLLGAQVLLWLL